MADQREKTKARDEKLRCDWALAVWSAYDERRGLVFRKNRRKTLILFKNQKNLNKTKVLVDRGGKIYIWKGARLQGHGFMEYDGPRAFHNKGPITIGASSSGFSINPLEYCDAIKPLGSLTLGPMWKLYGVARWGEEFIYMTQSHWKFWCGSFNQPIVFFSDAIARPVFLI